MHAHDTCRPARAVAFAATALAIALSVFHGPATGQSQPKARQAAAAPTKDEGDEHPLKGGQAIVVLVNDEPITAYEIEQRALFIALNSGGGENMRARLEARWAQIVKDPKTNERFQQLLREKNVKNKEQAMALQKQFAIGLQKYALEQLQHEDRSSRLPQFRKQARDELIEEHVKLQEAKRVGIDVGDDEAKRVIKEIATRNKMNEEQFAQQVKSQGLDINTMRDKFRAQGAWREVVRRRFSMQIAITQGEVDRKLSANATESGEDGVELQVAKITMPLPIGVDQATIARRFADAEALQRAYTGCKSMAELAKRAVDARFDDAKYVRPSSVAEPTRSLLLSAKDGDVLPPATTAGGIELYAVCGRRALRADDKQRERAQNELAQQEFEILAKRHLRDLMQDAHIEYR
jgi:peptidyl-prolyl cis-trans isomerase SurA